MALSTALTPAERTLGGPGSVPGLLSSSSGQRASDPLEPHRLPGQGLQGGLLLVGQKGEHVERIVVMPDAGFEPATSCL